MTIKTLTTTLLLATSFLLFTGCNGRVDTNEENSTLQVDITSGDITTGTENSDEENSNDVTSSNTDEGNTVTDGEITGSGGSLSDDTSTNDNTNNGNDDDTSENNDDNSNSDDNDAITPTVTLTSLKLSIDKTSLNKDENTTVRVMATYSDNSTKEVTGKVAWIVTPSDAVKVTDTTLTALQDKAVVVKAKMNTVSSNAVSLKITWIVNGHVLPPEPDKTLNDSTLLGIDVNDNGVRDDVERYIYENYEQPIERGIFMQSSRAYNSLLTTQPVKHKENETMNNAASCHQYWIFEANPKPFDKYDFYSHRDDVKMIQFNTVKRLVAKRKYELSLSGGVYSLSPISKEKCEFDDNGILGDIK